MANKTKILFLAADPTDASRLRIGKEFREIKEQLTLAKLEHKFTLALPELSVRPKDITGALLTEKPQIVHFSGHGTPEGRLCFENESGEALEVKPKALSALFERFENQVRCVLLNACYSEVQAKAISKHIDFVIGMNDEISDEAAIAFSLGFYQALGAGEEIEEAYKFGCVQIGLHNIPEFLTPKLLKKRKGKTSGQLKSQVSNRPIEAGSLPSEGSDQRLEPVPSGQKQAPSLPQLATMETISKPGEAGLLSMKSIPSIQEILQGRQLSGFVGRQDHIRWFCHNLQLDTKDKKKRFVVNVFGQSGVGKTTLLQRLMLEVSEAGGISAFVNEEAETIVQAMLIIAGQLGEQGLPLPAFAEGYGRYTRLVNSVEKDPQMPLNLLALLRQQQNRVGAGFTNAPPSGIAMSDLPGGAGAMDQGWELVGTLNRKLADAGEVDLVLDPVKHLTVPFLQDLNRIARSHVPVLFFDTYEQTGNHLDKWLRYILEGRYGTLAGNVILTIAGQVELEFWTPFAAVIHRIPLEAFSIAEARRYLSQQGIRGEEKVAEILRLSGRLPLYLSMLASQHPGSTEEIGDMADSIVRFFLRSVEDPALREAVLNSALPRYLNRDVAACIAGNYPPDELFDWLRDNSFIVRQKDHWLYHPNIRSLMVNYKKEDSPGDWVEQHEKLGDYYEKLVAELGANENDKWVDPAWQEPSVEWLYHRLCQSPSKFLSQALSYFLSAVKVHRPLGVRWADAILEAGTDSGVAEVERWGRNMAQCLSAIESENYAGGISLFAEMLRSSYLDPSLRPAALDWRGYLYILTNNFTAALRDLDEAIRLAPQEAGHWIDRGMVSLSLGRYDEALEDFNRSLEIQPDSHRGLTIRGVLYQTRELYDQAVADLEQAIEAEPLYAWAHAELGETYRLMGKYQDALAPYSRAIELYPIYYWAYTGRAKAHRALGDLSIAMDDLNQALKINPHFAWALAERGTVYFLRGKYAEASADFTAALQAKPHDPELLAWRGDSFYQAGNFNAALADTNHALEIDPGYIRALTIRGLARRELKDYPAAVTDFTKALELDPSLTWVLAERGQALWRMGDPSGAVIDLSEALKAGLAQGWMYAARAYAYQDLEDFPSAIGDLRQAIELEPQEPYYMDRLAELYLANGNLELARAQFLARVDGFPDDAFLAHVGLGITDLIAHTERDAREEFNTALEEWDATWKRARENPGTLLAAKAIALACTGHEAGTLEAIGQAGKRESVPCAELDRSKIMRFGGHEAEITRRLASLLEGKGSARAES